MVVFFATSDISQTQVSYKNQTTLKDIRDEASCNPLVSCLQRRNGENGQKLQDGWEWQIGYYREVRDIGNFTHLYPARQEN